MTRLHREKILTVDDLSLAQQIALLSPEERVAALEGLDPDQLLHDWHFWRRPSQVIPSPEDSAVHLFLAGRGAGKDLDVDTPIPTPTGWTRMGDLQVGDQVFDQSGQVVNVTKAYSVGLRESFCVRFDDRAELVAGSTHEWIAFKHKDRSRLAAEHDPRRIPAHWWKWRGGVDIPTKQGTTFFWPEPDMVEFARQWLMYGRTWRDLAPELRAKFPHVPPLTRARRRLEAALESSQPPAGQTSNTRSAQLFETKDLQSGYAIPTCGPLDLPDVELPIDPYVLGLWLGDGPSGGAYVCGNIHDLIEYSAILRDRGISYRWPTRSPTAIRRKAVRAIHFVGMHGKLVELGLIRNKHIPAIYLRASARQRMDLIRGLMDTDGSCDSRSGTGAGAGFVNKRIADGLYELCVSLGFQPRRLTKTLKATDLMGERPFYGVNWRPTSEFNPFNLSRKRELVAEFPRDQASRKTMRRIQSVTPVGMRPTRCIEVDSESHLFLAGHGMIPTHNTRTAAETVRERAKKPNTRILLVGRTAADVRDIMIEGESGIMNIHAPSEQPIYEPSKRRITWPNGSIATAYSSETPDALRGSQAEFSWGDELATWLFVPGTDGVTAWGNLRIATRLGEFPQIVVTTTPKRVPIIKELLRDTENPEKRVTLSRGKTTDNAGNLSSAYIENITQLYAGTRLGAQELEGILLDDAEGALWSEDLIEDSRILTRFNGIDLPIRAVGVDPSVSDKPKDECGIVAVGATRQRKFLEREAYVLEDASVLGSPEVWAKAAVACARRWNAPIVAEKNQGGELVRLALQQIDPTIPIFLVSSYQGKALRAEPIVLAYERGQVHHVGYHAMLEAQMTSWVPEETRKSPDRIDALVHGLTALLSAPPKNMRHALGSGVIRAHAARGQLPGVKAVRRPFSL